jgi:hypothetical protein
MIAAVNLAALARKMQVILPHVVKNGGKRTWHTSFALRP